MSDARPLGDLGYGTRETFHWHEPTQDCAIQIVQNVEPYLESAKRQREQRQRGDFRKCATIPLSVAIKWKKELGIDVFNKDHAKAVDKLLNSPDWAYLRTVEGHI